jgi:hypothetical protein
MSAFSPSLPFTAEGRPAQRSRGELTYRKCIYDHIFCIVDSPGHRFARPPYLLRKEGMGVFLNKKPRLPYWQPGVYIEIS